MAMVFDPVVAFFVLAFVILLFVVFAEVDNEK